MEHEGHVWQRHDIAQFYLGDIRGGIPLAAEQIEVLLRVVEHALGRPRRVLDLGCGDGILGRTVLQAAPGATCVFMDFSPYMLDVAKTKADPERSTFVLQDFGADDWPQVVVSHAPFDLVVSGLAIHHQIDERKRAIYADIHALLAPGGLFMHLEHVVSKSAWANAAHEGLFIDSIWAHHHRQGGDKDRDTIAQEFFACTARDANILAPLNVQLGWLEEIGFIDVDCFFKLFEITLFGGRKAG